MKTEKVYTQNQENQEWTGNIQFFNDEIKIMENRLSEITSKNTSKDILSNVEHFQNQLFVQKDNLSTLKHQINLSKDMLVKEVNKNSTAIDHRKIVDHSALRDNMTSFDKNFKSLRQEFNQFLSKYM
jgi:hypothetical protein